MEAGQGCMDVYGKPFFDLPDETAGPLLEMFQTQVPFRLWYQKRICEALESFTKAGE